LSRIQFGMEAVLLKIKHNISNYFIQVTSSFGKASSPAALLRSLFFISISVVTVSAHASPFENGWTLDLEESKLTFQSLKDKNGIKREISSFASYSGDVDKSGNVKLTVDLDSVDTKVDLRNVRMRFLFFETFKYPQATVTTLVERKLMERLLKEKRLTVPIDFELDLHGVKKVLTADTVFTMFTEDQISIASVTPVSITTEAFGLNEGVAKLEEAAKVKIIPTGDVAFDFVFRKKTESNQQPVNIVSRATRPNSTALETSGDFSEEECLGRFEILSQTGAIYFRSGSSRLDPESYPLLNTVFEIVSRCPTLNIVVAGHTDAIGGDDINLSLSISRADSVMRYLVAQGVNLSRITAIGYGETVPVAPNDTERNRSRNRRIEFKSSS